MSLFNNSENINFDRCTKSCISVLKNYLLSINDYYSLNVRRNFQIAREISKHFNHIKAIPSNYSAIRKQVSNQEPATFKKSTIQT